MWDAGVKVMSLSIIILITTAIRTVTIITTIIITVTLLPAAAIPPEVQAPTPHVGYAVAVAYARVVMEPEENGVIRVIT